MHVRETETENPEKFVIGSWWSYETIIIVQLPEEGENSFKERNLCSKVQSPLISKDVAGAAEV